MSCPAHHLFTSDPAAWVLSRLEMMGISLEIDSRVRGEIAVDAENRALVLSPALLSDWPKTHWRITRGCLFLVGGPTWAPEFAQAPATPAAPASNVYPLVRRVW